MNKVSTKQHIVVDVGPLTAFVILEIILIILKITGYISYSWMLILSPVLLIILCSSLILLFSFLKLIKDNIF